MAKVVVVNHVTLDGVMQGPGRPDEDTRDGFAHGGWANSRNDDVMAAKLSQPMSGDHAFLFGRRTYDDLLAAWNAQGGPHKDALNNARKYVISRNPATRLAWPNSTLLHGDAADLAADLKKNSDGNLVLMGSGELIQSLMASSHANVSPGASGFTRQRPTWLSVVNGPPAGTPASVSGPETDARRGPGRGR